MRMTLRIPERLFSVFGASSVSRALQAVQVAPEPFLHRGTRRVARYHTCMRRHTCLVAMLAFAMPMASGQVSLPDLGDSSASVLSPQLERKLGESVMRDIRFNEP